MATAGPWLSCVEAMQMQIRLGDELGVAVMAGIGNIMTLDMESECYVLSVDGESTSD